MFKDTSSGEAQKMFTGRQKRLAAWLVVTGGAAAALGLIEINDYAAGPFEVRAMRRAELRAAVSGFLTEVNVDEGESVSAGQVVARLEIPDLTSRIARNQAELREAQAELALLEAGPREVEIIQERRRVAAALAWRDVAALEFKQQQLALDQDIVRLEKLLHEFSIERDHARQKLDRLEKLRRTKAVSAEEYEDAVKLWKLSQSRHDRTAAERNARLALGTLAAQGSLAEREAALAHAQAALELLQAGSRREKIDAARAAKERLDIDRRYLGELKGRLEVRAPAKGRVTTHRLGERIGAYFAEGELICEMEDTSSLEVSIALDEDRASDIEIGQRVDLKVRALPFEVLEVDLLRIAPRAAASETQSTVIAYCQLAGLTPELRSGLTGHARVYCGRGSIARVLATKVLRFLRTEFWWAN
jgi:HlyD family secretion protein